MSEKEFLHSPSCVARFLLPIVTNTELVEVSLFYREAKTMSVAVEMLCLSRVTITKIILTITKISNL